MKFISLNIFLFYFHLMGLTERCLILNFMYFHWLSVNLDNSSFSVIFIIYFII